MSVSKKAMLTEALRRMQTEVAPGKVGGKSETYSERLARVLWLAATGYEATMIVGGEKIVKTMLPNLGAQAIVLDRLDGKVASCNQDEDMGVQNAPAQPTALGVARLNALSQQAPDQTVQ